MKYYSEEFISAPLTRCTVYRNILQNNKVHLKNTALIFFGNRISYGKLFAEVDRCAGVLTGCGLKAGDIISLCTAATPEAVYLMLAADKLGILANFVNPLFTPEEITARINDTGCRFLFVLDALYSRVKPVINELKVEKIIVIPVLTSTPAVVGILGSLKKGASIDYKGKVMRWKKFYAGLQSAAEEAVYQPDTPAIMVYSSGSTGASKGIVLTNDGINATILNYDYGYEYCRGDIFLAMIPIWFSTGNVLSILMPLQKGLAVVLEPQFNADVFIRDMKKYPVGLTLVATSIWVATMKKPEAEKLDLSHMKYPITGGEQVLSDTEDEINAFLKDHGCKYTLIKGYGMCEMGSTLTTSSRIHSKKGSVGYPILGKVLVAAFDMVTGEEMPYGKRGELRAITPAHMKEYFHRPDATAEFFRKDSSGRVWACTGDIGYVDEDGDTFILGRATDSYISDSGKQIFLFDAENVILQDPAVALCEVIEAEKDGRKISAAHIVLKAGQTESNAVIIQRLNHACRAELPPEEQPVLWKIRDSMPVHASGKRDVAALKAETDGYFDAAGKNVKLS